MEEDKTGAKVSSIRRILGIGDAYYFEMAFTLINYSYIFTHSYDFYKPYDFLVVKTLQRHTVFA